MSAQASLAIAAGAIAGFMLGLVGGGGSILATPLLLYVVGVGSPHLAIGTGATAISAAALFNFATHARAGHVRWSGAVLFAAVGVGGAIAGAAFGQAADGRKLFVLFGALMAVVGGLMLRPRPSVPTPRAHDEHSSLRCALLAFVSGTVSGFFGVGGGFLIVPCLLFAYSMPMIEAVGSSLLAVSAFSIATAASYARSGLVDWPVAGWFILGGIGGGFVGMRIASRLDGGTDTLRRLFAILILGFASYVFYRGSSGSGLAGGEHSKSQMKSRASTMSANRRVPRIVSTSTEPSDRTL